VGPRPWDSPRLDAFVRRKDGTVRCRRNPEHQTTVYQWGEQTIVHELRGLPTGPPADFVKGDGIVFRGRTGELVYGSGRAMVFGADGDLLREFMVPGTKSAIDLHVANFVKVVRLGDPGRVRAQPRPGILAAELCHLGSISHRVGQAASIREIGDVLEKLSTSDDLAAALDRMRRHLTKQEALGELTLGAPISFDGPTLANPEVAALVEEEYRRPFELPAANQV